MPESGGKDPSSSENASSPPAEAPTPTIGNNGRGSACATGSIAVDISGRPYLIWKVTFTRPKIGEMDTELFREWFQAFAQNAGITLHVENLYGENNHHIAETCFKGLARALRTAVTIDPRQAGRVPSTKGTLNG